MKDSEAMAVSAELYSGWLRPLLTLKLYWPVKFTGAVRLGFSIKGRRGDTPRCVAHNVERTIRKGT